MCQSHGEAGETHVSDPLAVQGCLIDLFYLLPPLRLQSLIPVFCHRFSGRVTSQMSASVSVWEK
jgi:hypothetical protein